MKQRRSLRLRLEHILKGIARIEQLTSGKTAEDYLADEGLREMIERNIARISEAARFVPDDVRARYPAVPWRRIVGIGNVIRHDYDEIDDRVMWIPQPISSCPSKRPWSAWCATSRKGERSEGSAAWVSSRLRPSWHD